MSTPVRYAELEIGISAGPPAAAGQPPRYRVELRFDDPEDAAARPPVVGEASIDAEKLLALHDSSPEYGRALSSSLFATEEIEKLYDRAKVAVGSGERFLRVKLFVERSAPELHRLRWELLLDPETDARLATSERILFSRFGDSDEWRTVTLRPRGALRALVAVSSPSDIESQGLALVDVEGEIARAREHLNGIEVEAVGKDEPLTLDRLIGGLGEGVDILYLVCHGALVEKGSRGSVLWLQNETGQIATVRGEELARRVGELAQPPRLVVLASCESAGSEKNSVQTGVIAGQFVPLAPLLAEAGVHAVVAMQGQISMETVKTAMPVFFSELLKDGQIDRAMARARGRVWERPDSWMPALFLRLKDGRIWQESPGSETLEGLADWLAAGDLPRVEDMDPYRLGATASDYGASGSYGQDDPYVPRSIDGALRAALRPGSLVLLVGPSKAGKTRTAFEALRSASGPARLVVPAVGALERLAAHPRLRNTADPVVIWFDDIHRYLTGTEQVTPALLARLTGRPGETVVLGTLRTEERDRLRGDTSELSREARSLLDAAHASTFELTSTAQDPDEQAVARAAYPDEDLSDLGLAEGLAYAPALLEAYRDAAAAADPLRHLLIRTAIDWERVGGPEPIPEQDLVDLAVASLFDERPDLEPDEHERADALKWARARLPGSGRAVLLRTDALPESQRGYWPFSYLVAADDGDTGAPRPIPDDFWARVIRRLAPESTPPVGDSAYRRGNIAASRAANQKGADAGNSIAMYNLGVLLAGLDPPQLDEARTWYERAAAAGHTSAMANLGALLAGLDPPQLDEARDWFQQAADAGDSLGMYNLGRLLADLDPPQLDKARDWYEQAAAAGESLAMYNLGVLAAGQDPPQLDEARDWYEQAAAAGNTVAMTNLGVLLAGLDPPQLLEARVWFLTAALAGDTSAMFGLGAVFAGMDPPRLDDARNWYRLAAEAGHSGAMNNLGLLLAGLDAAHLEEGIAWIEQAATAGHTRAMFNLGALLQGLDPPQPDRARTWYEAAAAAGDSDAMFHLGLLLAGMDPPEPDDAQAWFAKAAAAGHSGAMTNLEMLLAGNDPPQPPRG